MEPILLRLVRSINSQGDTKLRAHWVSHTIDWCWGCSSIVRAWLDSKIKCKYKEIKQKNFLFNTRWQDHRGGFQLLEQLGKSKMQLYEFTWFLLFIGYVRRFNFIEYLRFFSNGWFYSNKCFQYLKSFQNPRKVCRRKQQQNHSSTWSQAEWWLKSEG